jgi:hypothetical protein
MEIWLMAWRDEGSWNHHFHFSVTYIHFGGAE